MSQSTKITLRDIDKNILQLNRKNMPDNIVYSQQLSGYAKKEDIEETPTIPTKLSELQNDEGYIKDYTQTDPVYTADKPNLALKSELPSKLSQLQNDEGYIKDYTQTDPIYMADKANIALKSELPTKLSDLQNDEGYIKDYTETDPVYTTDKPNLALKSEVPTKVSELQNDSNFISDYIETDPIYTADKPNLALKSEIPTKLSDLQNDEGYIDGYTETDPIYTADKPNIALKSEIPTDLSAFTDTSNIILNAKNNAITEANSYTDQEKVKYLPLAGGVMTGTQISRSVTSSNLLIRGGTGYTTGATLALYGNTCSFGYLGGFRVITHDGTNTKELVGFPDGRLTWNNNPVTALPAGTVAGTLYVGATRQFTTIAAALDHIYKSSNGLDKVWNILLDPGEYSISGTITGLWLNIAPVSGSYSTACRIVGGVTFQDSNITLANMHIGTESLSSGTASILVSRGYFVAERCVFYAGANTVGYSLRFDFCATGQLRNCKFYAPTTTSGSFSSLILHYNSSVYLGGSEGAFIGTSGVTKTYAMRTRSNSCVFLYGQVSVTNYDMGIWCAERSCCFGQNGSFTFSGVTTNSSPADGTVGNDNSYINI